MIAQVPIAKFEPSEHQGLLSNCLLHQCLDIVLADLKASSRSAKSLLDPSGCVRSVRTFLAAYIADLPEQQALSCVASNYAPSSTAGPNSLGNAVAQPLRHGRDTLYVIQQIMKVLEDTGDQNDLAKL